MRKEVRDILYLTYDGIAEPLGESQIIPYLRGLSDRFKWNIDILSFEKKHVLHSRKNVIKQFLKRYNIGWIHKYFTAKPPLLSTVLDMYKMYFTAINLMGQKGYKIIHARSLLPAYIGLKLKRKFPKTKLIFDMRGFWQDQRIESGVWHPQNPIYKWLYNRTKAIERELLINSDHIVVLTEAAKLVIEQWKRKKYIPSHPPISVIPCCAIPEDIPLSAPETKTALRKKFHLPGDAYLIGHIGSFIPWYLFEEMIMFFKELKKKRPDAHLVLAIKNLSEEAKRFFANHLDFSDFTLLSVPAKESKLLVATLDAGLVFVQQTFSSAGASPTKLAELLFAGVPVIATDIGDVRSILDATDGGIIISDFSRETLSKSIDLLLSKNWKPQQIREKALPLLNVEKGINAYNEIYQALLK